MTSRNRFRADMLLLDDPGGEPQPWQEVAAGPATVRLTDGRGRTRTVQASQVTFTHLPEPEEER